MVLVQDFFSIRNVQRIGRVDSPRKRQQCLQVRKLHVVVGRLRIDPFQFGYLTLESGCRFLAPFLLLALLSQLFDLIVFAGAQLVLYVFDLLVQEVFPLLAVQVFAGLHLDALLQRSQLGFPVEYLYQVVDAVLERQLVEQFEFVFQWKREVRTDEVDKQGRLLEVFQCERKVRIHAVRTLNEFLCRFPTGIQ